MYMGEAMQAMIKIDSEQTILENLPHNTKIDTGVILEIYKNPDGVDSGGDDGFSIYVKNDISNLNIGNVISDFRGEYNIENKKMTILNIPEGLYNEGEIEGNYYSEEFDKIKVYLDDSNISNNMIFDSEIDGQYERLCGDENGMLVEDSFNQFCQANKITIDSIYSNILHQLDKSYVVEQFIGKNGSDNNEIHFNFNNVIKLEKY